MAKKATQPVQPKNDQGKNDHKKVEAQEVRAVLRYLRHGPKKVRLVGNLLKGLAIPHARAELSHVNKHVAMPLLKLLNSAVANSSHNNKISEDRLFVKQIRVDEGPSLKRFMPKAHGRATEIKKRSSHITLILGVKAKIDAPKVKASTNKKDTGNAVPTNV